jgi:biotin carboxyl carrier protein
VRFEIDVAGRTRIVTVVRTGATFAVTVDGQSRQVDAARITAHAMSLLVDTVWPHDTVIVPGRTAGQMTVTVDGTAVSVVVNGRRSRRRNDFADGGSGPQQLIAPMPGKIVRVLVKAGDVVEARQALVVVEAMKMENELRAVRGGTVSEVHAHEGRSVDAGALLVTIQ